MTTDERPIYRAYVPDRTGGDGVWHATTDGRAFRSVVMVCGADRRPDAIGTLPTGERVAGGPYGYKCERCAAALA